MATRQMAIQAIQSRLRASYDGTATATDDRHWVNADGLSADAANSKTVRQTLRNRTRYEVANGGYASGMIRALAVDMIATGPRLQMLHPSKAVNEQLEKEWQRWSKATRLAKTLRTMVKAKVTDGEAFAVLTHNSTLPTLSRLQLRLVEADQITTPFEKQTIDSSQVDGIDFDNEGNPIRYWMLREHPGSDTFTTGFGNADPVDAAAMIHWFTEDRPGQHRGIPDLTPSLRLFADHRRYLRAAIRAAETVAEIAAVMKTTQTPEDVGNVAEPMDTFDLEPGSVTVLPEGYELGQLRAEQPTTTYTQFNETIVTEEARPLLMPRNIATGDSSSYNYASGRLDHQTYDRANDVERDDIETVILERVFVAWLQETLAVLSGIAPSDIDLTIYEHAWFWSRRGHVDPQKESKAQETRLNNLTTTLAEEYAQHGKDWETQLRQRAKEKELMAELGLETVAVAQDEPEETEAEEADADDETAQATRD